MFEFSPFAEIIITEALANILDMLLSSECLCSLSSWIMHNASTHMYLFPRRAVNNMAGSIVLGNECPPLSGLRAPGMRSKS